MDPLATEDDVIEQLGGRALTAAEQVRLPGILAKASALFRREARQDFTESTSTVRLKVEAGRVYLEQAPATDVTTVVDDDGTEIDFEDSGQWLTVSRDGDPLVSHEFVTVTYDHGGDIPDLVRYAIAEIAAQALGKPAQAAAGIATQQRSAGGFQETNTYAAWALGSMTRLSPEDVALARSYRRQGTKVIVCQP